MASCGAKGIVLVIYFVKRSILRTFTRAWDKTRKSSKDSPKSLRVALRRAVPGKQDGGKLRYALDRNPPCWQRGISILLGVFEFGCAVQRGLLLICVLGVREARE